MKKETLRVTWKIVRRKGHGRTPQSYCNYIIENKNHKHKLKVREGSKLFDILDNTVIFKREGTNEFVLVDVLYDDNDNFISIIDYKKISYK